MAPKKEVVKPGKAPAPKKEKAVKAENPVEEKPTEELVVEEQPAEDSESEVIAEALPEEEPEEDSEDSPVVEAVEDVADKIVEAADAVTDALADGIKWVESGLFSPESQPEFDYGPKGSSKKDTTTMTVLEYAIFTASKGSTPKTVFMRTCDQFKIEHSLATFHDLVRGLYKDDVMQAVFQFFAACQAKAEATK